MTGISALQKLIIKKEPCEHYENDL